MTQDQLRSTIDGIRARLKDELDAQLAALGDQQDMAVEAARKAAETEADQRWASKVEAVRAEWVARLEGEVAAAKSEAERRMVAESMRLRVEAEQAAAESAARVREELEQALATERQRAAAQEETDRQRAETQLQAERMRLNAEIESIRRRADQELSAERQRLAAQEASDRDRVEREIAAEREKFKAAAAETMQQAAAITEARASERQSQLAIVERLLRGVAAMTDARSLTGVLEALIEASVVEAPRVALFLINGATIAPWKSRGFNDRAFSEAAAQIGDQGLLGEVARRAEPLSSSEGSGPAAPAFAALPEDRAAIAAPLIVGGHTVALLYADDGTEGEPEAPASWPEAIQLLSRHASASLSHVTAVRTTQALSGSLAPGAGQAAGDDDNSARRYARLLVSEIKLYNENSVRLGRQHRDLLDRLRPEIERARRMYEERVPAAVGMRGAYFQQELVQTLADGDPSLLGGSA
jgi:hypothetical protein